MATAAPPPPAPPKTPPPPPPARPSPNGRVVNAAKRSFTVTGGVRADFQRTVIYGPGGVGKTELASNLKQCGIRPLFLDIGTGTSFLDVERVSGLASWEELRSALNDDSLWNGFNAVVIDDLTSAEELVKRWILDNVSNEKGNRVSSIEGYGFGKGYTHVYEVFLQLLSDLDRHIQAGRHVICIAHECTSNVPNPFGEDFLRYEPRLQTLKDGKNSIRARVKEWTDHLLFVGFDVFVNDSGKGQGSGTRTIYPIEMPTHMAKTRCLAEPIPYQRGSADLWVKILGANANATR